MQDVPSDPDENRASYAGRWVAWIGGRIAGQGGTPEQALWAARAARYKETPQIEYIPTMQPMTLSERLLTIRAALPEDVRVYLVGGAVRDMLLDRPTHDLDFVMPAGALAAARRVADKLGGAYYPLDEERQTGRVILFSPDGKREIMDFALLRAPDLEGDLSGRDFTVNAMAVDIQRPTELLDPLGGAVDLRLKQLRACSPPAFEDDPVRILRGIRQGIEHNLHIQKETLHWMRQAVPHLAGVSAERKRDEIFRILDGEQPAAAVRALEMLGVLPFTLPELSDLKGVTQSPPHVLDVWNHTLDVLRNLEALLKALDIIHDPDQAGSLMMGLVALRLGRYREQLQAHLNTIYTPERTLRALLYLAALYHDVGKPQTRTEDGNGRIRFIEHERVGASLADARAQALPLSNEEADRIKTIVNHHLRPILLSNEEQPPSRRAVYRFFRDCGAAGVDICLVSMADVLATYGAALPQATWERHLDTVRVLLEGWWEYPEERIFPPQLLDGHDIIKELNLQPGALIGQLLEMVREAQAEGRVGDRDSALTLLHAWIAENPRL